MPPSASASRPVPRKRALPDPYKTAHALAWRNTMVAAINAGLEQGLFDLEPGANHWEAAGAVRGDGPYGVVYHFALADGTPAIAWVAEEGFDDLVLHAALWPTPDAERWIFCNNARRLAGEVFAQGSLERWQGAFLQPSPEQFAAKAERLAAAVAAATEPLDGRFSDRARPAL